jgi:hypothetical protein
VLTSLNVTGDPKLEQARSELERALKGVDVDDVRSSEAIRNNVKSKVDAILKSFDF